MHLCLYVVVSVSVLNLAGGLLFKALAELSSSGDGVFNWQGCFAWNNNRQSTPTWSAPVAGTLLVVDVVTPAQGSSHSAWPGQEAQVWSRQGKHENFGTLC